MRRPKVSRFGSEREQVCLCHRERGDTESAHHGFVVAKKPRLKVRFETSAAAQLRESRRQVELFSLDRVRQTCVLELFQIGNVLPVALALGLFRPEQIGQREKWQRSSTVGPTFAP